MRKTAAIDSRPRNPSWLRMAERNPDRDDPGKAARRVVQSNATPPGTAQVRRAEPVVAFDVSAASLVPRRRYVAQLHVTSSRVSWTRRAEPMGTRSGVGQSTPAAPDDPSKHRAVERCPFQDDPDEVGRAR
ncbi:hypothetical protein FRC09_000709 [Ceratobasidium sp. 395]|nr:hypothetical protein FRC09_000709 [Ceratobasidium sp. 395]